MKIKIQYIKGVNIMAYKKNYKRRKKSMKKYSFNDRYDYYERMANKGKTIYDQEYAYGYLDGMRGVKGTVVGTEACRAGNDAGLRFWSKMTQKKI